MGKKGHWYTNKKHKSPPNLKKDVAPARQQYTVTS